jgi:hypothetical protein
VSALDGKSECARFAAIDDLFRNGSQDARADQVIEPLFAALHDGNVCRILKLLLHPKRSILSQAY